MNSSRYPFVAPVPPACQAFDQLGREVISNDNCRDVPSPVPALSMVITLQTLVSRALEALQEAGDLAKRLKLTSWHADYLQKPIEHLDTETLPEIRALKERLEVEAKRP
jgi:hypothetical protein